jgi:hypothetical protein
MSRLSLVAIPVLFIGAAASLDARELKPKLGPHAIALQQSPQYLRSNAAPDYWALSPFYVGQLSNSACSLAAITMLINALRGMPVHADERLVTQEGLRDRVANSEWTRRTTENGGGVTWQAFAEYLALSLAVHGLDARIEMFKPSDDSAATLEQLRRLLAANERSDRDIVLVYFNQGVMTGDWDGPHISPLAAYDAEHRRVLVLDVDRQWYGPYWTSDEKLLEAMLRPAPARFGPLAGQTGGLLRVIDREQRSDD